MGASPIIHFLFSRLGGGGIPLVPGNQLWLFGVTFVSGRHDRNAILVKGIKNVAMKFGVDAAHLGRAVAIGVKFVVDREVSERFLQNKWLWAA